MILPAKVERDVRRPPNPPMADPEAFPWLYPKPPMPGELLTMPNGERWFHPYSGSRPWQVPAGRALEL